MPREFHSFFPVATPGAGRGHEGDGHAEDSWRETVVTAVATMIAVLIVGFIAVLMGMA